jgi:hypothetical protein
MDTMDAERPAHAQIIVSEYLRMLEKHAGEELYPGSLRDLPYAKETIRAAFKTSVLGLVVSEQMTGEMREYLEIAYVSLADYLDDELAGLLREYRRAGEDLAEDSRLAREKVGTAAWRRVSDQSALAGEIAKAISVEAETLRREFRSWQSQAT